MDFETLVSDRRSIRGYKPDAVPREVIDEVISITKYAPSSMNTQPWHFHVVTGEPLERIREGNTERMMAGHPPDRETRGHGAYVGVHRERQKEIAADLFEAMGIDWGDKEGRMDWTMRGFRQFDAPVSIVVTVDRSLDESPFALFDLGAATHGLVLAAWSRGLGTVINGQGIMQSAVVREHANIPDDEVIVTCVAIGYPAEAFAANDVKSSRVSNEGLVSYVGFDD
ncbi:MAG: nitroreductase [Dehalococcoidia bacterium]|nr:nitroreductase [Dehalococcoidia bacterium]